MDRLTSAQTAERIKVGYSTFMHKTKHREDFPKPIRLSSKKIFYLKDEVDSWLMSQR